MKLPEHSASDKPGNMNGLLHTFKRYPRVHHTRRAAIRCVAIPPQRDFELIYPYSWHLVQHSKPPGSRLTVFVWYYLWLADPPGED